MFNGIIRAVGFVSAKTCGNDGTTFTFASKQFDFSTTNIGDSVAINGVCLTVAKSGNDYFKADLSQETLNCSTFNRLNINDTVNMEKALKLNQSVDGHLVSGHTDGVGVVKNRQNQNQNQNTIFEITAPDNLVKYIAKKGSICINGVSLTVNQVEGAVFMVNIVPHTLSATTLDKLKTGDFVNLEVDIIAKYLQQLLKHK